MSGGQILSKKQTIFFTSVDPMNEEHEDQDVIDMDARRLAWYNQKVWKKHQNTVCWVDVELALRKDLSSIKTRSSLLNPERYHDGNWRNHKRESICVTPTSSEDFL